MTACTGSLTVVQLRLPVSDHFLTSFVVIKIAARLFGVRCSRLNLWRAETKGYNMAS